MASRTSRPVGKPSMANSWRGRLRPAGSRPALAEAGRVRREATTDAGAVGTVGELGLMQVRPVTAAMLGHRGPAAELLDRATNARFGVAYLARAWRLAGGDVCRALAKYRAGRGDGAHDAALHRLLPARPRPAGRRGVSRSRRSRRRPAPPSRGHPHGDPARCRQPSSLLANRFWAAHVARVRAVEIRTARIMGAADAAQKGDAPAVGSSAPETATGPVPVGTRSPSRVSGQVRQARHDVQALPTSARRRLTRCWMGHAARQVGLPHGPRPLLRARVDRF